MANLEHTTSSMLPIQSFLIHMAVMCGYGATEGMWAKTQQRFSGCSAPLQLSGVPGGRWHRTRESATPHPPPSPPLSRRGELWEWEGAGSGSRGVASSESTSEERAGCPFVVWSPGLAWSCA